METIINKKLPQRQIIQKVKGRTFHLPLPLQETWKKLYKNTDPININHELYILVRSIPTKSKIIWEEIVNVKKGFDALVWLKHNNPLYSNIILPETHDGLCLEKLNNPEFEIQETENNDEFALDALDDNNKLLNSKSPIKETKNNVETILNNHHKAMLTQIIDDNDDYYDQYTIYPLYEKKSHESAVNLYQLLKIQDLPFDNRKKI